MPSIPDLLGPARNPETAFFWDAAARGRFVLPYCDACLRAHWYPRAFCPFCFSGRIESREASGQGEVYSWTILRRASPSYVLAYVALREGPIILTNIVDSAEEKVRIGALVAVRFVRASNGENLPAFAVTSA